MDGILFLAHGTIRELSELPDFLRKIRRGREPSSQLIAELTHRYEAIGGSPLLRTTQAQARAVSEATGLPSFVAMRLWHPSVEEVMPEVVSAGVRRLCLLPLAQFSVDVYATAAKREIADLGGAASRIELLSAPAWGSDPEYISAQARLIERHMADGSETIILTAHSLPRRVIEMGDSYARETRSCADAIERELGKPVELAYQSEGADGGEWIGPRLEDVLERCAARGDASVVVAPFGFLSDHVETLYDLDLEAKLRAESLGLAWTRVPALNLDPAFVQALANIARRTLESG
jgi:ferrochelatase